MVQEPDCHNVLVLGGTDQDQFVCTTELSIWASAAFVKMRSSQKLACAAA